jgi:hypothetical protein
MGTAAPPSIPETAPPAMAADAAADAGGVTGGVTGGVERRRPSSMSRTFLPMMCADLDDKIRCSY